LNILEYGSALGQDVYVTREDYEVAIEIAKEFKTTDSKDLGRIRRIRQIFAIIILLGFVVGFVLTFIL